MTRRQARKHDRRGLMFLLIVIAVLVVHMAITTIRGNQRQQERAASKAIERTDEGLRRRWWESEF